MMNIDFTWAAYVQCHGHHVNGKTSQVFVKFLEKLDSQSLNALITQIGVQCFQVIQTSTLLKCYHL